MKHNLRSKTVLALILILSVYCASREKKGEDSVSAKESAELKKAQNDNLLTAIEANDEKGVLTALENGADANKKITGNDNTPFLQAIRLGNKNIIRTLYNFGAKTKKENAYKANEDPAIQHLVYSLSTFGIPTTRKTKYRGKFDIVYEEVKETPVSIEHKYYDKDNNLVGDCGDKECTYTTHKDFYGHTDFVYDSRDKNCISKKRFTYSDSDTSSITSELLVNIKKEGIAPEVTCPMSQYNGYEYYGKERKRTRAVTFSKHDENKNLFYGVTLDYTNSYDKEGRLLKGICKASADGVTCSKIKKADNKEEEIDIVHQVEENSYNEKGQYTTRKFIYFTYDQYDQDRHEIPYKSQTVLFEYEKNGNMIKEVINIKQEEKEEKITVENKYEYDANENIISFEKYQNGNLEIKKIATYSADNVPLTLEIKDFFADGKLFKKSDIKYDKLGNEIEANDYYSSGKEEKIKQTFKNKTLLKRESYEGKKLVSVISYHENGNFKKKEFLRDGKVIAYTIFHPDGRMAKDVTESGNIYDYNISGKLVQKSIKTYNGIQEEKYDNDGNLLYLKHQIYDRVATQFYGSKTIHHSTLDMDFRYSGKQLNLNIIKRSFCLYEHREYSFGFEGINKFNIETFQNYNDNPLGGRYFRGAEFSKDKGTYNIKNNIETINVKFSFGCYFRKPELDFTDNFENSYRVIIGENDLYKTKGIKIEQTNNKIKNKEEAYTVYDKHDNWVSQLKKKNDSVIENKKREIKYNQKGDAVYIAEYNNDKKQNTREWDYIYDGTENVEWKEFILTDKFGKNAREPVEVGRTKIIPLE